MPLPVKTVTHVAAPCVAVHVELPEPAPKRFTAAESSMAMVAPETIVSTRLTGSSANVRTSSTTNVSMTVSTRAAATTVMVSTYVPTKRSVGSRDHLTLPVPVPLAVVSVNQVPTLGVAVHGWVSAPAP